MPTVELLAEIEALKAKNKELAEHVVFWVADSKEQWTRAERATNMAALWKRCAKKWKKDRDDQRSMGQFVFRRLQQSDTELSALKKDARLIALNVGICAKDSVFEECKAAKKRIIEATKEEP